jgi:hypothetical protein
LVGPHLRQVENGAFGFPILDPAAGGGGDGWVLFSSKKIFFQKTFSMEKKKKIHLLCFKLIADAFSFGWES